MVPHGIKAATFRYDREVEELFTSTTVRTRDTVFLLFVGAGTNYGESARAKPDEAQRPSVAFRRPDVESEEAEGSLAPSEEMHDDSGRDRPLPGVLRRRDAEATRSRSASNADRRREVRQRGATAPNHWKGTHASSGETAAAMTSTTRNLRQDVSESLAQLCNCVPLSPCRVKLNCDQCWGCNDVFEGGGF